MSALRQMWSFPASIIVRLDLGAFPPDDVLTICLRPNRDLSTKMPNESRRQAVRLEIKMPDGMGAGLRTRSLAES
jgi:hypothetical protein